jgi:hypothetical protein
MRRHSMLMLSLSMFTAGIGCQLYSMFNPEEPYIQQLSFMFVAMPGALAIINHYYNYGGGQHHQPLNAAAAPPPPASRPQAEENQSKLPDTEMPTHKRTPNQATKTIRAHQRHASSDTSLQRALAARHLSGYSDDDKFDEGGLADGATEPLFGEFK